jgi:uncharacterized protein YbjQ (UPF0145 family)
VDVVLGVALQHPDFVFFLILIVVGYTAGRIQEARHYKSIRARENTLGGITVFSNRFPPRLPAPHDAVLVSGSVVVSEDYFKQAVAGLQTLFGGRLRSYESLLDRARREAVLRMKEDAKQRLGTMIINVKFETYSVPGKAAMGAVEILAYGTALVPQGAPAARN